MAASKVSMKLLINTENNKVLFAEAGKECVDFLFHILSLPVATVIRLLKEQGMVGCLENLYSSIENLNETYIQPDKTKDSLLKPYAPSVPLFLLEGGSAPTGKVVYKCNYSGNCYYFSDVQGAKCVNCNTQMNCPMTYVTPPATVGKVVYKCNYSGNCYYFSDVQGAKCVNCNTQMNRPMTYVTPPATVGKASDTGGFVKGVVTYMVMDDLVVKPMSTISSLTLLNQFKVKDIASLKEKEVTVTMKEAVKLLKTSLYSKKVLTDVFLSNN